MQDPILTHFLDGIGPVRPKVKAAYLFGSRARGTERPDSDYDLLLVVSKDFGLKDKDGAPRACPRSLETRLRPSGFGAVRPAHHFQGDIAPKQKPQRIHPRASPGSSAQADKLYDVVLDILLETGRLVSLKIFREEIFQKLSSIPTPFMKHILDEGIKIG